MHGDCSSATARVSGPAGLDPGWIHAAAATLDWAWRGSGRPPVDVGQNPIQLASNTTAVVELRLEYEASD